MVCNSQRDRNIQGHTATHNEIGTFWGTLQLTTRSEHLGAHCNSHRTIQRNVTLHFTFLLDGRAAAYRHLVQAHFRLAFGWLAGWLETAWLPGGLAVFFCFWSVAHIVKFGRSTMLAHQLQHRHTDQTSVATTAN